MRKRALIIAAFLWTFSAMAAPIDALIGIWCGPDISYEFWKDRLIVRKKDAVDLVKMIDHAEAEGEGGVLVYWSPYCPYCATLFMTNDNELTEVGQSEIKLYRCGSVRDKSETPKRD
jgi:thioredoxin-related protein